MNYEARAQELLQREYKMLIGGELVGAKSGKTYPSHSPSDGRFLANIPYAQAEDVEAAVAAASKAFPAWRKTPLTERAAKLREFIKALQDNKVDIGILDAADSGNPVTSMIGDVDYTCRAIDYQIGVAMEVKGQTLPSMGDNWLLTRREPYGVVARIVAYNHSALFTGVKFAAPLLMGNTLIIKAPDQDALPSLLIGELASKIFPPGVVNIITGDGPITGDTLVRHPKIKRISLIGSIPTGKKVAEAAAQAGIKHVSLELGGKNPIIIFPDADIDKVVEGIANGMNCHWSQGQSCGSTTRAFLHESIHDQVLEKLKVRLGKIRIGNPLDPETQMGCLVSEAQFNKVMGYIDLGKEGGANLYCGGAKPEGAQYEKGFFVQPTVFQDVTMKMRIAQEEIFGPVLSVLKWNDVDDVVQQANSVEYGLTASVWTKDLNTAMDMAERLEAGYVWINGSGAHFLGAPFGGQKQSGTDSEEGIEELYSFTQIKTVSMGRS